MQTKIMRRRGYCYYPLTGGLQLILLGQCLRCVIARMMRDAVVDVGEQGMLMLGGRWRN